MNCPICREPFIIPRDGLSVMKKDFKMDKLLNVRERLSEKAMCERHEGEEMRMFCQECKLAICVRCFIESHKAHDCSDIKEMSDALSDLKKISELWRITEDVFERLEKVKNDVIKHLGNIEKEINITADILIAAVERDREQLLSEVKAIEQKRVKQWQEVKQELEQHKTELESFKRNSETLLSSGTAAGDAMKSLHKRAEELINFDVISHVDSSLPPVNVTFASSPLLDMGDRNFVGTVTEEGQLKQMMM